MALSITTLTLCYYSECHVLFTVMLDVVMLRVIYAECRYAE
jgi:hypothetical protein